MLTLRGVSNLLKEEETVLELLDPYHRDSRDLIWRTVMKGEFDLPVEDKLTYDDPQNELERG